MALTTSKTDGSLVSLDQLSEEMQGQQVGVIGIVNTVTERARRDGQRFIIVGLELLGGVVEVTVWPEALQRTEELWQTGRTVRVQGRVRLRGEQLELSCDDAEEFAPDQPSTLSGNGSAAAAGTNGNGSGGGRGQSRNGNGSSQSRNGNGHSQNTPANGYGARHASGNGHGAAEEGSGPTSLAGSNRLVQLAVTESDDPQHDAMLLREVIGVILEYPGRDKVNLEIRTPGRRVLMELPVVSTGYCDPLRTRLEDLLGPDTVAVTQEMPLGV